MAFTKTGEASIKTIEVIANDYIESLERGDIPWLRPWTFDPGVFTGNGVTNHEYSFLNRMLVSRPGKYYTAKQLIAKKAEMVKECPKHLLGKTLHGKDGDVEVTQEYWESLPDFSAYKFQRSKFSLLRNRVTFTEKKVYETGKLDADGNPETREYRYLKYYYVVWAGYTSLYEGEPKPLPKAPRIKGCDALIQYYIKREGINLLEERGSEAFYRPSDDSIHLPAMEQFKIMEEFYSTAFHEMTHSTGVKKRLGRDMGGAFGSKSYAREELVAEIGASFLTNFFGIRIDSVERNNTAYIQSWIKKLQKDPSLIVKAASGAEKAMKFILNGYAEPEDLAPKKPAKQAKKPKGEKKGGTKMPKEKKTTATKKEGAAKRRSSLEVLADKLRNSEGGSVTYLPGAMVAVTDSYTMIVTDLKDLHNIPEQNPIPVESIKNLIKSSETDTSLTLPDKLIPLIKMRVKETGVKRAVPLIKLLNGAVVDVRKLEPALKAVGSNFVCFNSSAPFKPISVHEGNWHTHIIICPMRVEDAVWLDSQSGYVKMTKDGYTRN